MAETEKLRARVEIQLKEINDEIAAINAELRKLQGGA